MTVISKISVFSHKNNIGGKVWNPAIRWSDKYAVFISIESDQGDEGIGECWCFDAAPDSLVAYLRTEVVPQLIGINLDEFESRTEQLRKRSTLTARHGILMSALSGMDIAVWDLRAQQANCPLWAHLNPNGRGYTPLYASGGLYATGKEIPALAAEMRAMADSGFQLVKMKVGGLELAEDLERVRAVLNELPGCVKLIIDGVYSYDADQALELFESLPADRIEAFQSPVPAADIRGMKRLSAVGVPIMAIEAEYREEVHRQLVEECGIAFLQTAPIACGGISRVRELSKLTRETPTQLSLEISSTAIALMAACQIAAADNAIAHVEYHYLHRVFFDDLTLEVQPDHSDHFSLSNCPGLGISLPIKDIVAEFEMADSSKARSPQIAVH